MTVDHHVLAALALTGSCIDVPGALYLAYDLLGYFSPVHKRFRGRDSGGTDYRGRYGRFNPHYTNGRVWAAAPHLRNVVGVFGIVLIAIGFLRQSLEYWAHDGALMIR